MSDIANEDRCACNGRQSFQGKEMPLHQQDRGNAFCDPDRDRAGYSDH